MLVSFCLPDPRAGVPWHQARRDPTGLSPDPAKTQEAVVQVFAAPAVSWRGSFSVHTWIAVKPTGALRCTRYEVLEFGFANGALAVRIDRIGPGNYWFGARPQILLDRRGGGVDEMIAQLRAAVANSPYPNTYRPWPRPNSNTFPAHIARQIPNWGSTSPRMRSARISCRAAACSPRHPADPAFRCRFMGSAASCSPLARLSRRTCWPSVLEWTR